MVATADCSSAKLFLQKMIWPARLLCKRVTEYCKTSPTPYPFRLKGSVAEVGF